VISALDGTARTLILIGAVVTAVGIIWGAYRRGWPWLRRILRGVGVLWDTLVGSEPITHPVTGRELAPAKPGLGLRLERMEESQTALAETMRALAGTDARMTVLEREQVAQREWSQREHDEIDRRLTALEQRPVSPDDLPDLD
jgi:hypothetical protein